MQRYFMSDGKRGAPLMVRGCFVFHSKNGNLKNTRESFFLKILTINDRVNDRSQVGFHFKSSHVKRRTKSTTEVPYNCLTKSLLYQSKPVLNVMDFSTTQAVITVKTLRPYDLNKQLTENFTVEQSWMRFLGLCICGFTSSVNQLSISRLILRPQSLPALIDGFRKCGNTTAIGV